MPLTHHAQVAIVDDGHVDLDLLLGQRRQLAHGHLESAVADDDPHFSVRFGHFRAERRRERESHRPQATRRNECPRLLVVVVLRLPHLVLPDIGHHDRLALGHAPDIIDDMRGVEVPTIRHVLDVAHRRIALHLPDGGHPIGAVPALHPRSQVGQHTRQIAGQCHVHQNVLVELGGVNIDVDLSRVRGIRLEVAGHPVVEPHAERQQQVRLLNRLIHPGFPVHPHHPQIQRVGRRDRTNAQQCHRDRHVRAFREFANQFHRTREQNAVPGEDNRSLRAIDEPDSLVILRIGRPQLRPIPGHPHRSAVPDKLGRGLLRVFGDVHQHRPRSTRPGHIERLVNGRRNIGSLADQIVVLRHGKGHPGDVGFLKRVGPDQLAADLTRNTDDGRRIKHRRRDAGNHIGRPRARGRDGNADLTAGPREPVGHVGGPLFMPDQDVANRVIEHGVVCR